MSSHHNVTEVGRRHASPCCWGSCVPDITSRAAGCRLHFQPSPLPQLSPSPDVSPLPLQIYSPPAPFPTGPRDLNLARSGLFLFLRAPKGPGASVGPLF